MKGGILEWTLVREIAMPPDVADLLVPGEQPVGAYQTVRDSAIFTNKRLIVRDPQGMSGKKVEIYSLPYSTVVMWSTVNAEVELWTKAGHITVKLRKGIDVRRFDRLFAQVLL